MSASLIEVQRARKALQAFCARRNGVRSGAQLRLAHTGEANVIEILETSGPGHRSDSARLVLRLHYDNGVWRVYWRCENGSWALYPHLPESDTVWRVIDELEQAPLHVHWD